MLLLQLLLLAAVVQQPALVVHVVLAAVLEVVDATVVAPATRYTMSEHGLRQRLQGSVIPESSFSFACSLAEMKN